VRGPMELCGYGAVWSKGKRIGSFLIINALIQTWQIAALHNSYLIKPDPCSYP
jgi:hypothetical protein